MASDKRWTRPRWSRMAASSALALALAAAAAGCSASSASSAAGAGAGTPSGSAGSGSAGSGSVGSGSAGSAPAVTRAQAGVIFSSALATASAATGRYRYGRPAFWLPEAGGYPRFFVADVVRTPVSTQPAGAASTGAASTGSSSTSAASSGAAATRIAGVPVPASGRTLLVFDQASAAASWTLASTSVLSAGATIPALATDARGYVPQVPLSASTLLARPDVTGPLQAAVVDDGPASAAMKAVAAGPLTTGVYQAARGHAEGLTAPPGDVYQWELEGSPFPAFALRTASGGALVLYTMYLNTTAEVPTLLDKDGVSAGLPIAVPAAYASFLPADRKTPTESLEIQDRLSFAAVDPAAEPAKVTVIAIGGGPDYATAR